MAQQKNGLMIMSAVFMLLTLVFGVLYLTAASQNKSLHAELDRATQGKSGDDRQISDLIAEKTSLLTLVQGPEAAEADIVDAVLTSIEQTLSSPRVSDGTAATLSGSPARNLNSALRRSVNDRNVQAVAAASRATDLANKSRDLQRDVQAKDEELKVAKDALAQAEEYLGQKEAEHSAELKSVTDQYDEMNQNFQKLQGEYATHQNDAEADLRLLSQDIEEKYENLQTLRSRIFEQEDISLGKPDGVIRSVDHIRGLAYIDLGSADGLKPGATFSVYTADNGGVGRRDTTDIKAAVVVVDVTGRHSAECRLINQDRPVTDGDPIYNPLFSPGLQVEIALAGLIDFDGSPGSDREELMQLIEAANAKVVVQVDETGEFRSADGEQLSQEEAQDRITEHTRFLVVAELGQIRSESLDKARRATYQRITSNTRHLRTAAARHGVNEVSLEDFLSFIGYVQELRTFRPGQTFPGKLATGARSRSVNAAIGNRVSSGTTSSRFSRRRRANTQSTGRTSQLYE